MPKATAADAAVEQLADAPPAPPPSNEMPRVEPAAERPKRYVGVFNPQGIAFPTHEDLVAVVAVLGLQTPRLIAGEDQPGGNLLDEGGNVVIPAHLRKFFQTPEVQPQG